MEVDLVKEMEKQSIKNYSDKQKEQYYRDMVILILISMYRFTDGDITHFKLEDFVDEKGLLKKQIIVKNIPVFLTNPTFIKFFNKYYEWRKRNRSAYPEYPLIKSQMPLHWRGKTIHGRFSKSHDQGFAVQALQTRVLKIGKRYGVKERVGSYLRNRFIKNLKLNFKTVG